MRSFRFKMIQFLAISMVLSGVITYIIYKILQWYYRSNVRLEDPLARLRSFVNYVGDFNAFLIIFIPLTVIFFFVFTRKYAHYFKDISKAIHRLANGNFTNQLHIASNDELGQIAQDINLANAKLAEAVKRGDFAESSKDQLIVNLAHDLRTPLTSVLGYLDWMLKEDSLTSEQIRHYATIAYTKSKRLEKMIDELFDMTKMNYGMLPIDKVEINISALLMQLNEEMYPAFKQHGLISKVNLTQNLSIHADGEQLARVFENLINNAIRYGKDGQVIEMNAFVDEDDVVVQVINYGDYIPEAELPHIFDVFYTRDQARTSQENGTGLGLFIAKNIVERHDGLITVESNVIRTCFEVRLPFHRPSHPPASI